MNWKRESRSCGHMPTFEIDASARCVVDAVEQYLLAAGSDNVSRMHLSGTGAVAELEERLRTHYGMRHAVCVSSATSGLLGLALALDLRQIEFVTTPYTYGASLASWLLLGNRPLFADVDPH